MSRQREQFVDVALEEWRMRGVRRDWEVVLRGATLPPPGPARRRARRALPAAVVATGLVILAAPALAVIAGTADWPWAARSLPGVELVASVRTADGTATVRLMSRGGLVYRTGKDSKPKVLAPVAAKRRRGFAWELRNEGGKVRSAAIVTGAATVPLCAPCGSHVSGGFTLAGARALALLNGGARLRAQIGQQTRLAHIRLRR
jgi:hypothetical protein